MINIYIFLQKVSILIYFFNFITESKLNLDYNNYLKIKYFFLSKKYFFYKIIKKLIYLYLKK
jgi:hypothetical protein